jgi:transposase
MKKNSRAAKQQQLEETIGIDLGDKVSRYAVVDAEGEVVEEGSFRNRGESIGKHFGERPRARVALEAGAQSAWIARELARWGHEVIVVNARELKWITASDKKDDRGDAVKLARLARVDRRLLAPVEHRSEPQQAALSVIRARDALVRARTLLVNTARGLAKGFGQRLPATVTASFGKRAQVAAILQEALGGLLEQIDALSQQIRSYEKRILALAAGRDEVARLTSVPGVGTLTALTFVLTLGRPERFARSRDVAAYLGLRPRRRQSGVSDPALGIAKSGDKYLRKLLVQCAHHVLGHWGRDSALRRWGLAKGQSGGKPALKRAIVAVARKLAVLLHRLWVTGETFQPFPLRG